MAVAGAAAYEIYDQRNEIHALQARLAAVGAASERTNRATRALCSALSTPNAAPGLAALRRDMQVACAPVLRYPVEK